MMKGDAKMRKWFSALVVIVLSCLMLVACTNEKQEACVNGIKEAVQNSISNNRIEASDMADYRSKLKQNVDAELKTVSELKDKDFDEDFSKVYDKYVTALESMSEGAEYFGKDVDKYNDLFIEKGDKVRGACLKEMQKNYDLKIDSNYKDDFKKVKKGWYRKALATGEKTTVKTEYGDVEVAIEKIVPLETGYFDEIEKDQRKVGVEFFGNNISYKEDINVGVLFDKVFYMQDFSGLTIAPLDSAQHKPPYTACAGLHAADLTVGKAQKLITEYVVYKSMKDAIFCVGDDYIVWAKVK